MPLAALEAEGALSVTGDRALAERFAALKTQLIQHNAQIDAEGPDWWKRLSPNGGKPKAAVLPVPVCAKPIKSFVPCSKTGMAFSCMGVGSVKPNVLID